MNSERNSLQEITDFLQKIENMQRQCGKTMVNTNIVYPIIIEKMSRIIKLFVENYSGDVRFSGRDSETTLRMAGDIIDE